MNFYELTYILSPNLNERKIKDLEEKIISFIQEKNGTLAENRAAKTGIMRKNFTEIFQRLNTLSFYLEPAEIANLESTIKAEGSISRYIILKKNLMKGKKLKERSRTMRKIEKRIEPLPAEKADLGEIEKKLEEILE